MSPPNPRIITDPAELSPEWPTAVLRGRGLDVTVSSLRSEPVGTSQMAHNERVFLEYERDPTDKPAALVGKFPSPSEESRAAGARGGYRSETLFYAELVENLPIRTPECFYGAISDDHKTFTLLLEDLAPAQIRDLNALDLLA